MRRRSVLLYGSFLCRSPQRSHIQPLLVQFPLVAHYRPVYSRDPVLVLLLLLGLLPRRLFHGLVPRRCLFTAGSRWWSPFRLVAALWGSGTAAGGLCASCAVGRKAALRSSRHVCVHFHDRLAAVRGGCPVLCRRCLGVSRWRTPSFNHFAGVFHHSGVLLLHSKAWFRHNCCWWGGQTPRSNQWGYPTSIATEAPRNPWLGRHSGAGAAQVRWQLGALERFGPAY